MRLENIDYTNINIPFNYTEAFLYYFCDLLPRRPGLLSFNEKVETFHKQIELIAAENKWLDIEPRVFTITLLEQKLIHNSEKLDRELMIDNLTLIKRHPLDNWWYIHFDTPIFIENKLNNAVFKHQYLMFEFAWKILDYDYHHYNDEIWSKNFQPSHKYRFRYFIRKTIFFFREDILESCITLFKFTLISIWLLRLISY
ncbi:MAG: hypothetical protein QNJ64_20870 [Crocosphaera sp.]|nr:hypothetical protein [Crocosphaera sp.]